VRDEEPRLPPVRLTLPDRQVVDARLHAWRPLDSGVWLARVGVAMWSATGEGGVEPAEYVVWVPSVHVERIADVDYQGVPVESPPRPPRSTGWRLERVPARDGRPGVLVVHDIACPRAAAAGERAPEVSLDRALAALRDEHARPCPECESGAMLGPLV
jgi:Family of unknown function (DUF6233)